MQKSARNLALLDGLGTQYYDVLLDEQLQTIRLDINKRIVE